MKISDLNHIETLKSTDVKGGAYSIASASAVGHGIYSSASTYASRSYGYYYGYSTYTSGNAYASARFGAVSAHSLSVA